VITGAEALVAPNRINPIYLDGKLLTFQASIAESLGLKDGQIVQALVRLHGDQPKLLLQGRMIDAPASALAAPGESMWLRVQNKAEGQWSFQPVPAPAGTQASSTALTLTAPTNMMAPSLAPVVSRIANLLYRPTGAVELSQLYKPGTLDALLGTIARPDLLTQWRGLQLSMSQLTPSSLQQAMMGAMGSEVWLARGMPMAAQDPKQMLRKLIDAISTNNLNATQLNDGDDADSIGIISRLQRAVDDLEASQVQAVQAQAQQEILFNMTLPFADANPVELTIRRGPKQEGESPLLIINVHSKSEELGPVWLKTQLANSEQVELTMWSEDPSVVSQARSRSSLLGQELSSAGLTMKSFQVIQGARPTETSVWAPSGRGLVVDVSA
jgi:hypothetical protein